MKRMLKLILVLVSIAVLGCSSSKDVVNIPNPTPDGLLEVKFKPEFVYLSMELRLSEVGSSDFRYIPINESLLLDASKNWVLNGSYRINSGGTIIQDYINSFHLQLSIHESANKKSITYLIYDDGVIYPVFN